MKYIKLQIIFVYISLSLKMDIHLAFIIQLYYLQMERTAILFSSFTSSKDIHKNIINTRVPRSVLYKNFIDFGILIDQTFALE